MVVFGTLKIGEEVGNILFQGDMEDCKKYSDRLDLSIYYDLHICLDDGIILERIVSQEVECC